MCCLVREVSELESVVFVEFDDYIVKIEIC
jgi:hypothetical protein